MRCAKGNAPFFVDAAHFVHGAFLGMVWCFVRYFIPTPSGRKRFNVLGAVDALTKEIIMVVNETTVNAETVCQLLSKLAAHVSEGAITVVLDNARYQKCALVQSYAAALGIELLTFPEFRAALETCLITAQREHRIELETLLAWNFQSFRSVQTLPV